ncbi:leucine-rich repeat domain-containing protein [Prevotella sp. E9-3]|uniref:leucine-rich repeat domain-containing protein n=1 Tax=Prevotella sp. E9-3 TaxID=2913621 RepID=UPI001EDB640F|nr:leucine-rich repeat domain-containing protein [Prevotella sp. E9-3]UKK48490.1 leucine-rich repeat domain-containing protein [Prevotella sp. E9-3]
MKKQLLLFALMLLPLVVSAHEIEVKNTDGVTIYYNYINNATELEVTYKGYYPDSYQGNVVIPEEVTYMDKTRKVTSIGNNAFRGCSGLTSITIPNSVTSIGDVAFYKCSGLTAITIPNSVTTIGASAFYGCSSLTSVTIPNSVTSIEGYTFYGCSSLTSVTIPNSVTSIGDGAFFGCSGLTSVTIPNTVTSIGTHAFYGCSRLNSVTFNCKEIGTWFSDLSSIKEIVIGKNVTSIAQQAFSGCSNIQSIYSKVEDVFTISKNAFADNTYSNAKLYVPIGKKVYYEDTPWWLNFANIEEYDYGTDTSDDLPTCQTPTISYLNGVLTFNSDTEGAVCQYSITDEDIKSGSGNEVQLSATYTINVFASKEGYENSETATATLCWIDVDPRTESVAEVPAFAVLIKNEGGALTVQGIDDGTQVSIYNVNGTQVGTAVVQNGQATVSTSLQSGSIAIVKIGQKSVKVLLR